MADTAAKICDFIAQHGTRCKLPGVWGRYAAHDCFFHPPRDAEGLLKGLHANFNDDELVASGVCTRESDQNISLNDLLRTPTTIVRAVAKAKKKPPVNLLTDGFPINRSRLPICEVADEAAT